MFSLTTSSSGASRVTLQKLDAWDYRARFRGSQWRWLRDTRFGSAARGITTAPTSQLRPTSRQLLRRVNAFLEWYVRNGRRATKYFQPRVKIYFLNLKPTFVIFLSFFWVVLKVRMGSLVVGEEKYSFSKNNFDY